MNFFSVGGVRIHVLEVGGVVGKMLDNHIACPCRTVVVEEIVAIGTVSLLIVLVDSGEYLPFLVSSECQSLLLHPSSLVGVFSDEMLHREDSYLVVGETEYETKDKEILLEREHAPVDGEVGAMYLVLYAESGMTIV